jgi:hypothetical protein
MKKINGNQIREETLNIIVEIPSFDDLPPQGKEKTIYITRNNNRMYRWDTIESSYKSLNPDSLVDDGGVTTGLYSFDVDDEGYLCLYYEDGITPPQMFIDDEGYLWADIKGNEENKDSEDEPISPTIVDYARFSDLPEIGEANVIYHIALTDKYYVWNNASYSLYNSGS